MLLLLLLLLIILKYNDLFLLNNHELNIFYLLLKNNLLRLDYINLIYFLSMKMIFFHKME